MFILKVGTAEHYQDIEQNETRLRVPFGIYAPVLDEEQKPVVEDNKPVLEMVDERNESFNLTDTKDFIQETLERHLAVYTEDHIRYEEGKARQAALDQSAQTAQEISNITIA
jgi:hypothetical protein